MQANQKYDVAFSFAEEDLAVAEAIATAFRKEAISYYLYTEHPENIGKDLFRVSLDVYAEKNCRYMLMLISNTYVTKRWSNLERQMMMSVRNAEEDFIIPIRLDDTPVDGLNSNKIYYKWDGDAEKLAKAIRAKLNAGYGEEKDKVGSMPLASINATNVIINNGRIKNQTFNF